MNKLNHPGGNIYVHPFCPLNLNLRTWVFPHHFQMCHRYEPRPHHPEPIHRYLGTGLCPLFIIPLHVREIRQCRRPGLHCQLQEEEG